MSRKKVVVIGGGLGGISAAISLAQKGYEVSLYEKNEHIGGKVNRFEESGFGFDLGPSILTMPHIFERLFRASRKNMNDYVTFERIDHQWRSFFPNGNIIDLHKDLYIMEKENDSLSKKDIREYEKLLMYSKKLYETTEKGYFSKGLDTTKEVIKHHGLFTSMNDFDLQSTMYQAIEKRISNKQFREMLSYFIKYVGSSPYDAPAVLNMMIYMQHHEGIWYVKGGMHQLASALQKLAGEIGVNIHTNSNITRVEKNGNHITGVFLDNGKKITADYYISNMEVIPFYEKVLKEDKPFTTPLKEKFEPASSGLVMHLGVKKTYPQLNHHNFFFANDMKKQMNKIFHLHELPDDPVIYLVNVNKTDKSQAPDGYENLKILPHIPHLQENRLLSEKDYLEFGEKVLIKLEKMGLTDLRSNIILKEIWTPYDIERVYNSDRGAIYGTLSHRKNNKGFKHPKHSEKYKNLYFVGGTVNPGAGMPMVTLSGQQVAAMIIENDRK